jgi:hypothetical protein
MERSSSRGGEGPTPEVCARGFGLRNLFAILVLQLAVLSSSCEDQSDKPAASPARPAPTEAPAPTERTLADTIFGVPVPIRNYRFAEAVDAIFGMNWGGEPNTPEGKKARVWNELILNYEAVVRRRIEASREDVEAEITKTLKSSGVEFDWKKDRAAYEAWCKTKLRVSVEMFENMMAHLIKVRTLRKQVLDSIDPPVSEAEALEEFHNEQNGLSIELVRFDDLEKAKGFYEKATAGEGFWDKEKEKDPERFKRPGVGAAPEFLMHLWKLPRKAVFEMLEMEAGTMYPPTPIYKGHGVFMVLGTRRADEKLFPKRREYYIKQVKQQKKSEGFKDWLKKLKEEAL